MNTMAKMIIVLSITAILSGAILSIYNFYTYPKIQEYRLYEQKKAIFEVIPGAVRYETVQKQGVTFYIGYSEDNKKLGVAFLAEGNGFQGKISILVGMDLNMEKILAIKVLEQVETPGLGSKIVDDPSKPKNRTWFSDQFKELIAVPQITWVKNQKPTEPNQIQAITGATISSRSVVAILNDIISKMRKIFLENQG